MPMRELLLHGFIQAKDPEARNELTERLLSHVMEFRELHRAGVNPNGVLWCTTQQWCPTRAEVSIRMDGSVEDFTSVRREKVPL